MHHHTKLLPAVPIELKGILREHDQTFVVFAGDGGDRIVEAEFYEILSFHTFRRHVFERFDIRIVYRRGNWLRDVVRVFFEAGIKITTEDVVTAVWINEKDQPESEVRWIAETALMPHIDAELERLEAVL